MRFAPVLAILAVVIMMACGRTPSGIIKPDKMAMLMADIHTGEAVAETSDQFRSDSMRQLLKQSILAKHGVTSAQFDTSLYWYGSNVDLYMEVNDKTIEILEQRKADAEKIGTTEMTVKGVYTDADSAVVWSQPSALRLTGTSAMYNTTFNLRSDRGWERGDAYTLNLRPVKVSESITAVLAVSYDDGSKEYVDAVYEPDVSGKQNLTLYLDSARVARYVFGYVSMDNPGKGVNYVDSIALVRTRTTSRAQYLNASQHKVNNR